MHEHRKIRRAALLYNVHSQAEIEALLGEIVAKGYNEVCAYALQDDQDESCLPSGAEGGYKVSELAFLCERATTYAMPIILLTQYMKRNVNYLAEHPEQTMRMVKIPPHATEGKGSIETGETVPPEKDATRLAWEGRGCIFNANFKARYIQFLERLATLPGVALIMVNDEARLGAPAWAIGCYCPECEQTYHQAFGADMPITFDWDDPAWRRFIRWRFQRWNHLAEELREAVRRVNPQCQVGFAGTPLTDGWRSAAWVSGVDLDGMMRHIDDLCLSMYHTILADQVPEQFHPPAVVLGEVGRLAAAAAHGKGSTACVQGFNPPIYVGQTLERDGWWMGVIPYAVGINRVLSFVYETHKANPSIIGYEASFKLDQELQRHRPLDYAAIVHSTASESLRDALPDSGPASYHERWLHAASEPLRHCGIPYAYLLDSHLTQEDLAPYRSLVLPQVSAIAAEGLEALEAYVQAGGGLVAYGDLGASDAAGEPRANPYSFLERVFGVRPGEPSPTSAITVTCQHEIAHNLRRGYPDVEPGVTRLALRDARQINVLASDATVLARFAGENSGPAVVLRPVGRGRCVYWAGPPARRACGYWRGGAGFGDSPSFSRTLFANAVAWAASGPPPARIEGLPAVTGYVRARPYDQRIVPTHEFFPLVGEDGYFLIIASYWAEAAEVRLVVDLPKGIKPADCQVRECVKGDPVNLEYRDHSLVIPVKIDMDDPLLAYTIRFRMR